MTEERWTWSLERRIPSDTAAGKQVVDELLEQLKQRDWVEHDIFGVHLAVEEALVNAIKHGNQHDTHKSVSISYKMSPTRLRIQITDEGNGFNPDDVPDPTDEENLECPSGRGLMLMRSFMSSVQYNDVGNSVTMEKWQENSS
jgi:serine/threonine-protein kinase RsbW